MAQPVVQSSWSSQANCLLRDITNKPRSPGSAQNIHLEMNRRCGQRRSCGLNMRKVAGSLKPLKNQARTTQLFTQRTWNFQPRPITRCSAVVSSEEHSENVHVAEIEDKASTFTLPVFGAAILEDCRRRYSHYRSDITDGFHPKTAAATFFLFFACLTPCLAFGGLMATVTNNTIGVVESIIGTSVSGVFYALLAGQPLTLLGPTGLMVIFTGLLYKATHQLGLPFLPVYGWVGIWSFAFLSLLAGFAASNLIRYFTRFTDDVFSALISFGFISEACKNIGSLFKPTSPFSTTTALLSFMLSSGTYVVATFFSKLKTSRLLLPTIRNVLSDFGPPLAILIMSLVPAVIFPSIPIPELPIPSGIGTTSGRPWVVPLFSLPIWAVLGSAIPAALLTLLMFLDQNITTRIVNDSKNNLKKGDGYHLDLLVLGALMILGSLFGLPWMVASTVPSLSHVRSLATISKSISISGENAEAPEEITVGVIETRLTGIIIHICMGGSLMLLPLLRLVPVPVTSGLFLYMGITSLSGNQFVERLKLWAYDPQLYPEYDYIKSVPRHALHGFTALQLGCLITLWVLKKSSWGITFPLLILALMPIRKYVAGGLFSSEDLHVLDAHEA